jgi:hypothetical protein
MIYLVIAIVAVLFISFCIANVKQAGNVFNAANYWAEREEKWGSKK